MRLLNQNKGGNSKRAFTLTELAIVLGIIGLILGAIWTAAAKVYANNRVTKAVTEVLSVASSVRAMYAGKGTFPTANQDLTAAGVSFGWYPPDMIQNTTCVDGVSPCPTTPWNSGMIITAGAPALNDFAIAVQSNPYGTGTGKDCAAFLAAMVQQAASTNMIGFMTDTTNTYIAVNSSTTLTNTNVTNCTGDVGLFFSL